MIILSNNESYEKWKLQTVTLLIENDCIACIQHNTTQTFNDTSVSKQNLAFGIIAKNLGKSYKHLVAASWETNTLNVFDPKPEKLWKLIFEECNNNSVHAVFKLVDKVNQLHYQGSTTALAGNIKACIDKIIFFKSNYIADRDQYARDILF